MDALNVNIENVKEWSDELFDCTLKQLTDHSVNDSEKSALVRKLKMGVGSKKTKENDSAARHKNGMVTEDFRKKLPEQLRSRNANKSNSGGRSGDCNSSSSSSSITHAYHRTAVRRCDCGDNDMNSAKSMQELSTNQCDDRQNLTAAISKSNTEIVATGATISGSSNNNSSSFCSHHLSGGKRKPNRANSLPMPSKSDNSNRSDTVTSSTISEQQNTTNGGATSPRESLNGNDDKQTLNSSASLSNRKFGTTTTAANSAINNTAPHQSCSNSSHFSSTDIAAADHSPSCKKFVSSVHLANISELVDSLNTDKVSSYRGKSTKQSYAVQEEDDDDELKLQFAEMKNLRSSAKFLEYSSSKKLGFQGQDSDNTDRTQTEHSVDSPLEMSMLTSNSGENPYQNYQSVSINPSSATLYNNQFPASSNSTMYSNTKKELKKKKRVKEEVKLSDQIEGHIGYIEDVSYLASFVNNTTTNLTPNDSNINNASKKQKGKLQKSENEPGKRNKKNNGEMKTNDADKRMATSNNKSSFSSVSNSSSLSGDDMVGSKNSNDAIPKAIDSTNRTAKTKKGKLKNLPAKTNTQIEKEKSSKSDAEKESDQMQQDESRKNNSSSDGTDSEGDDDEPIIYFRSKKSNSLLPSKTISVQEEDTLYTVSDSEMGDREKGFVTPKNKHFKKKKLQQSKSIANENANHLNSKNVPNKNLSNSNASGAHNLGRGYESELESYSVNNGLQTNSFTSHNLSSSLMAISKISEQRSIRNHSPPIKRQSNAVVDAGFEFEHDFPLMSDDPGPDNGPKMPSYADITKSFNQPPAVVQSKNSSTAASVNSGHSSIVASKARETLDNTQPIVEEFPRLSVQSEIAPTEVSNSITKTTTNVPSDSTVSNNDSKPTSNVKTPSSLLAKDNTNLKEEMIQQCAAINDNESLEINRHESATTIIELDDSFDANSSVIKDNNLQMKPLVFGDDSVSSPSSVHDSTICNGNQTILTEKAVNNNFKKTEPEILFGFFDDNERSILMDVSDKFNPLDSALYDVENNNVLQSNQSEATDADDQGEMNAPTINDENHPPEEFSSEDFLNKAVRVQELEDSQLRKLSHQYESSDAAPTSNCATYSSSTTASPLSTSFDSPPPASAVVSSTSSSSSSILSNATSSPTTKLKSAFINCTSQLNNFKFVDNVDRDSFNYIIVIQYVYKSWKQCKEI